MYELLVLPMSSVLFAQEGSRFVSPRWHEEWRRIDRVCSFQILHEGFQPFVERYPGSFGVSMELCPGDSALYVELWRVHIFVFLR